MEYKYYVGTYCESFKLTVAHNVSSTTGDYTIPAGTITLAPWELKHVIDISEAMTTTSSTIGIPDKPSECVYIYDTGGPVRTFTISGTRYDNEEEISNLDFMHTQFNKITIKSADFTPFQQTLSDIIGYGVGIEWLTSTLQSTMKGYLFRRIAVDYDPEEDIAQGRVPLKKLSNGEYGEEFNVGITAFNYSFDNENPGIMNYSLTLVERNQYETGPIYREYVPVITKVS